MSKSNGNGAKNILGPAEMLGLAETKEGRRELARYIWRARTACVSQWVMEAFSLERNLDVQQLMCDISEVLDHSKSMCDAMRGQVDDGGYDA
jgi:hypothetical protein